MRLKDSIWQGNFGYWQAGYIHANLLMIGYLAWNGFLNSGRGFVVCFVDAAAIASTAPPLLNSFTAQFVPVNQLAIVLSCAAMTGELFHPVEPAAIAVLQNQAHAYDPSRDAMILLIANGRIEAILLQNLAIAPAECHQQVRDRWEEFQPCLASLQEQ
jgi:hypothetical protein